MKMIVGLGNPGKKYQETRHNVGFEVIDLLSKELDISLTVSKYKSLYGEGQVNDEGVVLLKPTTYMNLSGEAIQLALNHFGEQLSIEDILIVFDDVALEFGKLRLRRKGSSGGHNGCQSIIEEIGSEDFSRLRIGIQGEGGSSDLADYVLDSFTEEEKEALPNVVKEATEACRFWLENGVQASMNKFN